jgi:CheY-like chemotaxis protein
MRCDPLAWRLKGYMTRPPKTVLIVDDSAAIRRELCDAFARHGFIVCAEAENGRQAIEEVLQYRPDLIILDLSMPIMNGLDAAPELRRIAPEVPIILHTAFADAVSASDLKASGVTLVLPKSEPLETLMARVEGLFHA